MLINVLSALIYEISKNKKKTKNKKHWFMKYLQTIFKGKEKKN